MVKAGTRASSGSSENNCYNSCYHLSAVNRILRVIDASEIELPPIEIAFQAHVNPSTARGYLRRLLKEGKVVQPYPGAYCNKITHGMRFLPLRCHNVILCAECLPWLNFSDDVTESTGAVKVRVQFGIERRKITGRIFCDSGMDANTVVFALNRFLDMVKERTNHDLDVVVVKTAEFNRDYQGIRLDGVKCYTRKGLFEALERIYQKEDDVVRHEVKVSKEMSVDEFTALIRGGVSTYELQQVLFMVVQNVNSLVEAMKSQNGNLSQMNRVQQALVERMQKLQESDEEKRLPESQRGRAREEDES
jgi:hypothetical protein